MPTSAWRTANQCRAFLKSPGMSLLESPSKKLSYWRSAAWKANGKGRCATCPCTRCNQMLEIEFLVQGKSEMKKKGQWPITRLRWGRILALLVVLPLLLSYVGRYAYLSRR